MAKNKKELSTEPTKANRFKNAVVADVHIGLDEEKKLGAWVIVNYSAGKKQGFGGMNLEGENLAKFVKGLLEVVGVNVISQLVGKAVRVEASDTKIQRIGHFVEDKWLDADTLDVAQETK